MSTLRSGHLSSNKVRHQLLELQTANSLQTGGLTFPPQRSHVTCTLIGLRFGTKSFKLSCGLRRLESVVLCRGGEVL